MAFGCQIKPLYILSILHFITQKFLYPASLSSLEKLKLSNLIFNPEVGLSDFVPGPLVTK